MNAEMKEALAKDKLVSDHELKQAKVDAEQLSVRTQIAREQLATKADSMRAQMAVQQSAVDQARALLTLTRQQKNELKVRDGLDGMLQLVPVEVGQQVAPGTNLARVANPSRLKAEIKIAETQARTSRSVKVRRSTRATASSKAAWRASIRRSSTGRGWLT
jgi:HlyD family secretion protein